MYAYTNVGTPYYMSPEQINEERYNHKSDIWSLGCIIYETACLKPPFQADNYLSLAMKIKEGNIERIPSQYSDELQKVIEQMLQVNQESRPSVVDLINSPRINLKIKEFKVKEKIFELNQKEKELKKREEEVKGLEQQFKDKLAKIEEREKHVTELESKYKVFVSSSFSHLV
jgi:NIMA (never in mitosis gene a)-related kinase